MTDALLAVKANVMAGRERSRDNCHVGRKRRETPQHHDPHPIEARAKARLRLLLKQRRDELLDGREPRKPGEGAADIVRELGSDAATVQKLLAEKPSDPPVRGNLREIARAIEAYSLDPMFFFAEQEPGHFRSWPKPVADETPWDSAVKRHHAYTGVEPEHLPVLRDPRRHAPGDADLVKRLHEGLQLRDRDRPKQSTVRPRSSRRSG